jgi:hypothetical protein
LVLVRFQSFVWGVEAARFLLVILLLRVTEVVAEH